MEKWRTIPNYFSLLISYFDFRPRSSSSYFHQWILILFRFFCQSPPRPFAGFRERTRFSWVGSVKKESLDRALGICHSFLFPFEISWCQNMAPQLNLLNDTRGQVVQISRQGSALLCQHLLDSLTD